MALVGTSQSIYNMSATLGEEARDYSGVTPYWRGLIWTTMDTGTGDLSRLTVSAHSATYIDSPAYFIPDCETLDSRCVMDFILIPLVVEIEDNEAIRPYEMKNLHIKPTDALLFETENSRHGCGRSGVLSEDFVYLTLDAADLRIGKGAVLVGIHCVAIERWGDDVFPVHHKLLANNRLLLEGINLG